MSRINREAFRQVERKDTLPLRTAVFYQRDLQPAMTPILVGSCVVLRKPLLGTPMTQYLIMDGNAIAKVQISYPSEDDCGTAIRRFREKARPFAVVEIKKPKTGAMSIRRKEAA